MFSNKRTKPELPHSCWFQVEAGRGNFVRSRQQNGAEREMLLKRAVLHYNLALSAAPLNLEQEAYVLHRLASTVFHLKTTDAYNHSLALVYRAVDRHFQRPLLEMTDYFPLIQCYEQGLQSAYALKKGEAMMYMADRLADQTNGDVDLSNLALQANRAVFAAYFAKKWFTGAQEAIDNARELTEQNPAFDNLPEKRHAIKLALAKNPDQAETLLQRFYEEVFDVNKQRLREDTSNNNLLHRVEKDLDFILKMQLLYRTPPHAFKNIMNQVNQIFGSDSTRKRRMRRRYFDTIIQFENGRELTLSHPFFPDTPPPALSKSDRVDVEPYDLAEISIPSYTPSPSNSPFFSAVTYPELDNAIQLMAEHTEKGEYLSIEATEIAARQLFKQDYNTFSAILEEHYHKRTPPPSP